MIMITTMLARLIAWLLVVLKIIILGNNSKVTLLLFPNVLILTYVKYKKRKCSHGISRKSKTSYSIQSKRL